MLSLLLHLRSFYVSWTGGLVLVGRSSSEILVNITDPDPLIIVEVKLHTLDTPGNWTFNNNMGQQTTGL